MFYNPLYDLKKKYQNNKYISIKIDNLVALYDSIDDNELAKEFSIEFCRLIDMIESEYNKKIAESIPWDEDVIDEFVTIPNKVDYRQYNDAFGLKESFYNHYKKPEQLEYKMILFMSVEERKGKVNSTVFDYLARINTFGRKYLCEVYNESELPNNDDERFLFVYENIESIIARFNVKDEEGNYIKQKQNIVSALKKLYEFKYLEH